MKLKLFALLLFAFNGAFAQESDQRLAGMDNEINGLLQAYNAAGLSIAVVENGKVVYSHGFGLRDTGNKLPVTPDTIFPIGSTTKPFTAALLGILEGEGKFSLKDQPSTLIPEIRFYDHRMDDLVTIEDLLSHSSGIGNVDGTYIFFPTKERTQLLGRLKYLKPNGIPKGSWIYSNFGYVISASIAEQVTGQSWEKNIRDRIFTPLGMTRSSTSIKDALASDNHSLGYGIGNAKREKVLFAELGDDAPGGGINSTANDLAAWMLTWLNNGEYNHKRILPASYVRDAESYKAIDNGAPPEDGDPGVYTFGYGLGWKINSLKGHYKVHHGGNVSGFSSQMVLFPSDKLGIVVLTNQHNSLLPYIVSDLVTNRMLGLPRTAWNTYPVQVSEIYVPRDETRGTNPDKKPTHALADYSGKFSNPGYGTFEIVKKDDGLHALFPGLEFRLEHQYYDIFVLKPIRTMPQTMNPEFHLNFTLDDDGNVSGVKVNFQHDPVEFAKQPGGQAAHASNQGSGNNG